MTLLAAYGASGGMPPARVESLRVQADGRARAIVGNGGPPHDEAGVYQTVLAPADLAALRALCDEAPATTEQLGTIRSDSGALALELRCGDAITDVSWSPFAVLPPWLERAQAQMRKLLGVVRKHPHATLRLSPAAPGGDGELVLVATNTGTVPLRASLFLDGWDPPRVGGAPVELINPPAYEELAPGAQLRVRARASVEGPLTATTTLELPGDDGPFSLDAYLQA